MNPVSKSRWVLIAGGAIAGQCATVAMAAPQEGQQETSQYLAEVVVTATKRAESVQEVPIAITAVSAYTLEQAGVSRMEDIDRLVPNVWFTKTSTAFGSLTIRGVTGFSRNAGVDDRMSVYLDGAWLGQSQTINQAFYDVERIEVLRGPQGTLFGKNTVTGAVNIITRKPSTQEFGGSVKLDYGNYSHHRAIGIVNIPLADGRFAVKASGMHSEIDGYIRNLATGNDLDSENTSAGRLQVRFNPSDAIDINLSVDAQKTRQRYSMYQSAGAPAYVVINDIDNPDDTKTRGAALTAEFQLPNGGTVTSITSLRDALTFSSVDEDSGELPFLAQTRWGEDNEHFTQELRYASPQNERYDYVAGVYYQDEDRTARHNVTFITRDTLATGEAAVKTYAAFAHGNYHLTDSISLTGGLRYTKEDRSVIYNMDDGTGLFTTITDFRDSKSSDNWSPKIGVNIDLWPDTMLYASYSRGYKSGGWYLDHVRSQAQLEFDPEYVDAFEVGLKSDLLDGHLRTNLALFRSDYSDYQTSKFVFEPSSNTTIIAFTNAGKVRSQGVELELTAQPLRNLTLGANVGYLDAYYEEFKDAGGIGIDYDGNKLYPSTWTGNAFVDYSHPLSAGSVQAYADWAYRSRTHGTAENDPRTVVDGYGLLNARLGYQSESGKWSVYLWGQNLADKQYMYARTISFFGTPRLKYARPRTYGVSFSFDF